MDFSVSTALAERTMANWKNGTYDPDMFTDDATMWHNTDAQDQPLQARRDIRERLQAVVPDFRFDEPLAHCWEDGYVIQYVVRGTLPDGSELASPACSISTIRDGKIARVQEYIDSAHIQRLRDAFMASMNES